MYGGSCCLLFAGIQIQLYLPMLIASHLNSEYSLLTYFYLASEPKLCLIHKLTQVLLLVLVNLYFYATSTRQIGKQLVYNRSMQHFQVFSIINRKHRRHNFTFQVNFDLFTKLFLVVGVCWLFQVHIYVTLQSPASYFPGKSFPFHTKNLFHTNIFSFSYQKLFSHKYIFISSDACLARHFSFGIHWKDLHTVAGFALPLVDIYNV